MTTTTPMLRWSAVRDCARKAVYGAEGAPARDRTDREGRILYRGRAIGRDYAIWLGYTHGKIDVQSGEGWWVPPGLRWDEAFADHPAAVLAEVPVDWAFGVGHMDAFLTATGTAIEVLSSAHATDQMIHSKVLQLVGYMEGYPAAKGGAVVVVNPADFSEERFPIARGTDRYAELVAETQERVDQVRAWNETGELPARVCAKPADAWGHFCLHAEHCFDGFEEPELEVVDAVEARAAVQRFALMKAAETTAKKNYESLEAERKEIQAELEALPGLATATLPKKVGPYRVKRTDVRRAETLDVEKAVLAGAMPPLSMLADFCKPGAAYSTWKVDRLDDSAALTPDDFGDVAPWEDSDL